MPIALVIYYLFVINGWINYRNEEEETSFTLPFMILFLAPIILLGLFLLLLS